MSVVGKYALVTGGSRGIGRAVAVRLAAMGYGVIVNYLSNTAAAEETLDLIRKAGGEGELLPFDVADREAVTSALSGWAEVHGLLMWMPEADWYSVVRTNLDGFFNVTQPLLKNMLVQRYGRIVNVVSLSGIKGMPGQTNYSAAKGGLIAATKALAQEVAKKQVTVNAVAPGFIRTEMTADLDESALRKTIPVGRFGEPEEVADLVAFLVSKQAGYITGEVISINGGIF